MAEDGPNEVQPESHAPKHDVAEEKSVIPPPPPEPKIDDAKALAIVDKPEKHEEHKLRGSLDRDAELARLATQKRAEKKRLAIAAWESSKKASLEAELKKIEEKLEKKKAACIEKTKNKLAVVHKAAEEKRALVEAKRGEDILKAEERAAKYRATGTSPKTLLSFF